MRSLLAPIGLVAFVAAVSSGTSALADAGASAADAEGCGAKAASKVLSAHRRAAVPTPKTILCGPFAGRGSSTMVIALPDRDCKRLGRSWLAFRLEKSGWRRVGGHRGSFAAIAAGPTGTTGRQIRETASPAAGKCKPGGGESRLWRWNGKRFVPGRWHKGGKGGGGREERKRLVVSPGEATIVANDTVRYRVELFEGKRRLADVTDQTTLRLEYRGSQDICGSRTSTPVTDYCNGLGSCDQSAHTCTAISPGEWLVLAQRAGDAPGSRLGSASLRVQPKNNLTITPTTISNGIYGLLYEQQFAASGAAEPVTWEANRYTKSGYRVPLAFPETGGFSGSIDRQTGLMKAASGPPGPIKVVVRAWDRSGDSGEETLAFETQAPYCSTVCLYAGPRGELSLAWKSCGCTSLFNGKGAYEIHAVINGIQNPYWGFFYAQEPFNNGQYWETYAPHSLGQQSGDTIEISVKGERELGNGDHEYTPIGTSNPVVVK